MTLPDVNILLYACRDDAPNHAAHRRWLDHLIQDDSPFALSEFVLSAFLRIATHPRIFNPPEPLEQAVQFAEALRAQPNCLLVSPGPAHWAIFVRLCRAVHARGNLIPDAYLAALAIESGCELASTDGDFSRFPGLRWQHPLA